MLRRCLFEVSKARSVANRHRNTAQISAFLSSRNFSNPSGPKSTQGSGISGASQPNPSSGSPAAKEASRSGNYGAKILLGSVVVGGVAAIAAHQTGYLDFNKETSPVKPSMRDAPKATENFTFSADEVTNALNEAQSKSRLGSETVDKTVESENTAEAEERKFFDTNKDVSSDVPPSDEEPVHVKENDLASVSLEIRPSSSDETINPESLSGETLNTDNNISSAAPGTEENKTTETLVEQYEGIDSSSSVPNMEHNKPSEINVEQNDAVSFSTSAPEESGATEAVSGNSSLEARKDLIGSEAKLPEPLAQSYHIQVDQRIPEVSGQEETTDAHSKSLDDKKVSTTGNFKDIKEPGEGKIVLDLIDAIDAAKRKQAESDAYVFAEERRILKEKYEKELKDARARELMYAEEASILEKEFNREKAKAAAALKLSEEKAEQKLQDELQRKEKEAAMKLNNAQALAKAELTAAIAKEKVSQIEEMAEANLNISALCMAFYARSEEAKQSHSIHKLALGTLALEDALSSGMPIRAVVDALNKSVEGIDRDSLLGLALSSLPEETLDQGTSTQMQLNQKFNSLKGSLRHFSIIPAGGGGLLTHAVAHLASSIKVKEDESGEGVESLISKVDSYLVEGKIAEAADTLEGGVQGSDAEELVAGWVKQARNRAIVEQAHSLLQSYATSITFA